MTKEGVCISRRLCISCFECERVCPKGALGIYGREMSTDEVVSVIKRDEVFYFHSGGGVTLSGGSVLAQADFAKELLEKCKESGTDTAAELEMQANFKEIEKILPLLDEVYVDIKHMDSEKHRYWTGWGNELILENILRASQCFKGRSFHVRVPLIPGVNDAEENIGRTARFCSKLENIKDLEFLPFHRLGRAAYENLQREYEFSGCPAMTLAQAEEKVRVLKDMRLAFPLKISGKVISAGDNGSERR